MNHSQDISVVAIDDDPLQLQLIAALLKKQDHTLCVKRVLTFFDPAEAMAQMPADGVIAILCDQDMPGGTGMDWLPDLVKLDIGPVLLLTASGNEQVATEAFRSGVSDYLIKGRVHKEPGRLRHAISEAVRRYKLTKRNRLAARELKLANINLEDRNIRLREMTDTAHRFVDNVAHEFRTPLTVIQEFASILKDGLGGEVTPAQAEYLSYIQDGVRDLSGLVDDFLDTSKLKARVLRVDRREASVADVFEHVRPSAQARAKSKSATITFEVEPGLPVVFCDSEKIGRVILNLVVNAIKFSPKGGEIHIRALDLGNGDVQVSVRDHGIGISEEELPGLCERFRQAGDPHRDSGKGFGLGLNIARNLVWLNLGAMTIQSTPGEGSTFSFTLPIADHEPVLHRYTSALQAADVQAPVAVLSIRSVHPQASAEQLRSVLAGYCQSMDLLLCAADGKTLIALGPSEAPDRWIERIRQAWATAGPEPAAKATLESEWLGSWSIHQLAEQAFPVVCRNLIQERRCA